MATVLDNTQEYIERSFYEALRAVCVELGYTPDITTYPNTSDGTAQYKADLAAIKDEQGFAIELFNQGNSEDKNYKKYPRFVFLTESFLQGEYGLSTEPFLELQEDGNYDELQQTQSMSHQMFLNCHLIAKSTIELRTMFAMVNATLPLQGYLAWAHDPANGFFVENTNMVDVSSANDGIIEKIFKYRIPDIIWTTRKTNTEDIVPITHINLKTYVGLNTEIATHLGIDLWIPETP